VEEEFSGRTKENKQVAITRICLTGGPCAGKTTALANLSLLFSQMGYRVL
jgi:predicted ATPase